MYTKYYGPGGDDPNQQQQDEEDPMLKELMDGNQPSSSPSGSGATSKELPPVQGLDPNSALSAPPSPYLPSSFLPGEVVNQQTPTPTSAPATPAPTQQSGSVGHDGTYNGMTREQWRDAWMSKGGGMSREQVDAWMAQNGATKIADNGTFRTPFGEDLDLGTAYKSGNVSAGWTPVAGGMGSASGAGGGGTNGASGAGGGSGQNDDIHNILMQELQGLRGPVDMNDPRLKGQVDAFRNEQDRASDSARSALVERANYQGLPTGFVDAGIQSGIEDAGLETAKFQGQLTQQEYQSRRTELDRLLQMAMSSSDAASARELQAKIAELDRSQQNSQFYDTMGYNINRDQNNLDYLLARDLMNGGN